jgi:hypothetical protein
MQKSAREIPSRMEEIVAIVTVIELGFIEIIIIITIAVGTPGIKARQIQTFI